MRTNAKPFVKWAGGKSQLLDEIRTRYPEETGRTIVKYAEPFVGGGAVLFDVLNRYAFEQVYISDINFELITTYKHIRDNVDNLIDVLSELQKSYWKADSAQRSDIYYDMRNRFNAKKTQGDSSLELASSFIFLNKTCFNGLYRVNAKGLFNVPIGSYKQPLICDEVNLKAVSFCLKETRIVCADYKESVKFIDDKTLVYIDPPYRPLSGSANFTTYAKGGFDDSDQIELAQFIQELSKKGAYVIASNSDPKNSNADDNFFDDLYQRQRIARINANRMINSSAKGRGKIKELLITNY